MPWKEVSALSLKKEFVMLAQQEGSNISELCRAFNISRKTGYKLLQRYKELGDKGLVENSRRPYTSPLKTCDAMETAVTGLKEKHPAWGGRKLKGRLETLGHADVPAASTITEILRRNGWIDPTEALTHKGFIRFEHAAPNDLWQMDFKGSFSILNERCHPLTILDDHSRFNITLKACANERTETVQLALVESFRRYGLPLRMTMDNGSPWGNDKFNDLTVLTVWMIRLGIRVSHSRPYHPQTQGKDERFHRTLKAEAITGQQFKDLVHCQRKFDEFRQVYNLERPHESLGMKTPVTRYRPSERPFPEILPPIEYGPDDHVRKVQAEGLVSFKGKVCKVSKALRGNPIAFRPTAIDGEFTVYFCSHKVGGFSLKV